MWILEGVLIAGVCCFGVSVLMHSFSESCESDAEILSSVKELKELGKLTGDKTSSLLVAVSGKVGSLEAFKCTRSGVWSVYLTEKAKLVFKTKIEDGESKEESNKIVGRSHHFSTFDEAGIKWKDESEEILVSHKTVPWFLEDDTGRVNVVGFDPHYYGHSKTYVFDEPVNELFQKVFQLKGIKIVRHTCSEDVFEIGTPLSFFAKAFRDKDGTIAIRRTNVLSSKYLNLFRDGKSIDEFVSDLKSDSTKSLNTSVFFQNVGAVLCAIYGVCLIWAIISNWGKKDDSISKIVKSDSEEAIDGNVAEPPDSSRD